MNLEIFYFDIKHAIKVHDWIIITSGGLEGQRLENIHRHSKSKKYTYDGVQRVVV